MKKRYTALRALCICMILAGIIVAGIGTVKYLHTVRLHQPVTYEAQSEAAMEADIGADEVTEDSSEADSTQWDMTEEEPSETQEESADE